MGAYGLRRLQGLGASGFKGRKQTQPSEAHRMQGLRGPRCSIL